MPDEITTPNPETNPAPTGSEKPGDTTKVKVEIGGKKPDTKAPEAKPEQKPADDKKPYATFDTAESFMERVKRDGKKQAEETAKAAGFESFEAMQKAAEEGKKAIEAAKTEEQKREDERARLIKDKEEAETRGKAATAAADQKLIAADAKILAAEMGASVSHTTLMKALDLSKVTVDEEGNAQGLKEAMEALKAQEPALFTGKEQPKPVSTATAPAANANAPLDFRTAPLEQVNAELRRRGLSGV